MTVHFDRNDTMVKPVSPSRKSCRDNRHTLRPRYSEPASLLISAFRVAERIAPSSIRLSMMSCVEHINAFIGHEFMTQDILTDAHPAVHALLEWHFVEEIEHKRTLRAIRPAAEFCQSRKKSGGFF